MLSRKSRAVCRRSSSLWRISRRKSLRRVGCGAAAGWRLRLPDMRSGARLGARREIVDVGNAPSGGCQTSATARAMMDGKHPPMRTSFRRNWDRLINWGLVHTRQRGSSRHKLRRSMARAAGRRRSRLLRSPTEPRTMRSAAAKVAVILARSFVAGDAPPGRAGRNRQFRAGLSRWPLLTDGLASYQGKSVPCSSDFNSLFRRVGNFSANTLILLQPG